MEYPPNCTDNDSLPRLRSPCTQQSAEKVAVHVTAKVIVQIMVGFVGSEISVHSTKMFGVGTWCMRVSIQGVNRTTHPFAGQWKPIPMTALAGEIERLNTKGQLDSPIHGRGLLDSHLCTVTHCDCVHTLGVIHRAKGRI